MRIKSLFVYYIETSENNEAGSLPCGEGSDLSMAGKLSSAGVIAYCYL
jgi:hypothetical protein